MLRSIQRYSQNVPRVPTLMPVLNKRQFTAANRLRACAGNAPSAEFEPSRPAYPRQHISEINLWISQRAPLAQRPCCSRAC
jgi:hypothetical protein